MSLCRFGGRVSNIENQPCVTPWRRGGGRVGGVPSIRMYLLALKPKHDLLCNECNQFTGWMYSPAQRHKLLRWVGSHRERRFENWYWNVFSPINLKRNRTPHTQRLSHATELSEYAGACQQPISLSFHCVAVTAISPRKYGVAVVHQLYWILHCLFLFVTVRNSTVSCC